MLEEYDDDPLFDEEDIECISCGDVVGFDGFFNEDEEGPYCEGCFADREFELYMQSETYLAEDFEDDL